MEEKQPKKPKSKHNPPNNHEQEYIAPTYDGKQPPTLQ